MSKESRLVKQVTGDQVRAGNDFDIPNRSGDLSFCKVTKTPAKSTDIANKAYVDAASGSDLTALETDVKLLNDKTHDLGSSSKRWNNAFLFAVLLTTLTIGGLASVTFDSNQNELVFNTSIRVNGSIDAHSLNVTQNISSNDLDYHCFGNDCDSHIHFDGTKLIIKVN